MGGTSLIVGLEVQNFSLVLSDSEMAKTAGS